MTTETEHFGVDSISRCLLDNTKNTRFPTIDTIFLNISTLVRNNENSDISDKDIISKVYSDVKFLTESYFHYANNRMDKPNFPTIIAYIPDYSGINDLYVRNPSKRRTRIEKLTKDISRGINERKDVTTLGNVHLFSILVGNNSRLPYKELHDKYLKINRELDMNYEHMRFSHTRTCALISHVVMDYYLFNHIRSLYLLESYTGTIKTYDDLGGKIFKDKSIPFDKTTHILFGDSTYIRPMVKRKDKSNIIREIKNRRLINMSSNQLLHKLSAISGVPKILLQGL